MDHHDYTSTNDGDGTERQQISQDRLWVVMPPATDTSTSSVIPNTSPQRQNHNNSSVMSTADNNTQNYYYYISPKLAFLLVSLTLGELGDGLNIFQGIYLVGTGWNEGSVGIALSLMGLTTLLIQPLAGNWVDQTIIDRRIFLGMASAITALSASTILLVRQGNYSTDHALIFISKIVEGVSASFIGPCIAALTLANFGPKYFDTIMASNLLWGHIGSVVAAILAGLVEFILYPNVKYCFLIIAIAALSAIVFIPFLPQGDPMMGRGFPGKVAIDESGQLENMTESDDVKVQKQVTKDSPRIAATYLETLSCPRTGLLCMTGLFFQ